MPKVHRQSDSRVCGASTVVTGQSTVFANNLLISVQGDGNTHGNGSLNASVNPGTVFIEGIEMVVVGSTATPDRKKGSVHKNPVATTGSANVFAFDGSGSGSGTTPTASAGASGAGAGGAGAGAGGATNGATARQQSRAAYAAPDGYDATSDIFENTTPTGKFTEADKQEAIEFAERPDVEPCIHPKIIWLPSPNGIPPEVSRLVKIETCERLIALAEMFGTIRINSGYRPSGYNSSVGGSSNSQHLQGNAADISNRAFSEAQRSSLAQIAYDVGFRGFGIYQTFTHVDIGSQRNWPTKYLATWKNEFHDANGYPRVA